jgi:hypothetical protein
MVEISNKLLAVLVVISLTVSGFSIMTLLNKLNLVKEGLQQPTGRALTGVGNVTLTVSDAISIILLRDIVDFGSGYVNSSKPACATNATLSAGQSYNDSEDNDCWTDNTKAPTSLDLENDGNRNVTVTVIGPSVGSFFQGQGDPIANISWRARNNETDSCAQGLSAYYQSFEGTSQTVCSKLLFSPANSDDIAIDVQVVIPASLLPGVYTNSTIEFTASPAS